MKTLFLFLLLAPMLGLSQETYKGLVDPLTGIKGQVIMSNENGDTTHVYPPKPDWVTLDLNESRIIGNTATIGLYYAHPPKSIFYFWNQYLADCNKLVADTVKETGIVTYKTFPVKYNGKVIAYKALPSDTAWTKAACRKYKVVTSSYLTGTTFSWSGTGISYRETRDSTAKLMRWIVESEVISRDKVCQIKVRKATFDDFWDRWLVEKGIIEKN